MGISNANKELSASGIACGGSFKIKLSLTAEPNIVTNPTDIVLILDRSKSMAGSPLANLKKGAETFIDILDEATDGALNGQLGHGSRIGIVSFADAATKDAAHGHRFYAEAGRPYALCRRDDQPRGRLYKGSAVV